jgi:nucleoside 2-deoxyribosyltransferase
MIYIASPLFSQSELEFNLKLKQKLSNISNVYLPQEDGKLMTELIDNGSSLKTAKSIVFKKDLEAIRKCDIFLIVLDGRVIDEGAAFELGYAYAQGKKCYGLRTDTRREILGINNPMIEESCEVIFGNVESLILFMKFSNRLPVLSEYQGMV